MSLNDKPLKELDEIRNNMRVQLGMQPLGKSKDKAIAIASIEKLKPALEKLTAQAKPKKKAAPSAKRPMCNYDVADKVKPPRRGGTKFFEFVEVLTNGATKEEMIAVTMKFTGEKVETTAEMATENRRRKNAGEQVDGYCTATEYRMWKDLNNFVHRHGYGLRCNDYHHDKIFIFETKAAQDAWDAENRRVELKD